MGTQARPQPLRQSGRPRNGETSEHFLITWRRPASGAHAVVHMAISKKLLPRAVDRNQVRRLIREAVRHAQLSPAQLMVRLTSKPRALIEVTRQRSNRMMRAELDALLLEVGNRLN